MMTGANYGSQAKARLPLGMFFFLFLSLRAVLGLPQN